MLHDARKMKGAANTLVKSYDRVTSIIAGQPMVKLYARAEKKWTSCSASPRISIEDPKRRTGLNCIRYSSRLPQEKDITNSIYG